jgi:very-short-patch-repair endonuclease/DNA polymerase III delta prime subunit
MTLAPDQLDLARERIGRLFRYLSELQKLKTPPKVQLTGYPWKLSWSEVPLGLETADRGEILPPTEDGEILGDDFILKVRRPAPATEGSAPAESSEGEKLFDHFLELWSTIERESEKVELVLGDGMVLFNGPNGVVHHPLFLVNLTLEFDAETPEFVVRETDREPYLYTPLLRYCGVEETEISWARNELAAAACHPLGGAETTEFFSRLQEKLFPTGSFLPEPDGSEKPTKSLRLLRAPMLFLGNRNLGFAQAIEAYIQAIPRLQEFPSALLRVVGIDVPKKEVGEGAFDLLMTMPSNPEQERVAKRLEESSSVLVQGPPGTGKTHTIANLIGHLLAQGKSVLVTSHATKALRVVRDMVIPELRPLCVSVLEQEQESRKQLEAAVKGIVARFTTSDADELENLANTYQERRKELEKKLHETQEQLIAARRGEFVPIQVGDEGTHPARAAKLVAKQQAEHGWIPGDVVPGAALPLSEDEVVEMYGLNREIPIDLESDLSRPLPALDKIMTEGDFRALVERKHELTDAALDRSGELWSRDGQTADELDRLLEAAEKVAATLADESRGWVIECMRVGRLGGTHREPWDQLAQFLETTSSEIARLQAIVLETGAAVESELPTQHLMRVGQEILAHLRAKKNINMLTFIRHSDWKPFIYETRVSGKVPESPEDIEAIIAVLEIRNLREALRVRWENQMTTKGAEAFSELGDQPENIALRYVGPMRDALAWNDTVYEELCSITAEHGMNWQTLLDRVPADPSLYGEFHRIRKALDEPFKTAVRARRQRLELSRVEERFSEQERYLASFGSGSETDTGGIIERLRQATGRRSVEDYSRAFNWLSQLYSLAEPVRRRNELLGRLRMVAPEWADAIAAHKPPHDADKPPGEVREAWNIKQWSQELNRRQKVDFDRLQHETNRLRQQVRSATANYVENRTWASQLRRTGVRQQQALVGWLDLMRKIGTGKGKRAPHLKAMAREKLSECRDAVPVWIMPLSRLAESYHPGESMFDVVILDEASQCEITGLLAFALGRETLVVGDHEQVSPEAVGLSFQAVEALIGEFLEGVPNKELYDGRTSVYDLARQSFSGSIRLLEHFRCVDEIIAFSNALCYQGEIQPLRESSRLPIKPPTAVVRVENGASNKKVNQKEAEMIAALIMACCEQPEYEEATFGVISLVGEEQALAVDKVIMKNMELTEYQARRLVCGNAAQFQGDERDVIFLSLVEDCPDGEQLPLRTAEAFVKRFNVAASRARDQMWVIHSLDPEKHLKEGDLRRDLIEHCQDPSKTIARLAESVVEERSIPTDDPEYRYQFRIRRGLEKAGYRVVTDVEVGNYHLDLVVEGKGGRVAITCDGANEHPPERLARSLEREAVLERLGWRFLRARASSYYLDPEKTVEWVLERLEEMELEPPEKGSVSDAESHGQELLARVLGRAHEILASWYGEEADPLGLPVARAAGEDGTVTEEAATPVRGGAPKKASSIAARLEKRIKKIRSLSPTAEAGSGEEEDSESSGESSGEDAAARKPLGRLKGRSRLGASGSGRLSGWRNLLPLQKDGEGDSAEGEGENNSQ